MKDGFSAGFRFAKLLLVIVVFLAATHSPLCQCTTGNEPECQCSTAPVLCTVDDLDNYSFSMSSFQHPQDGPSPLCPGNPFSVPNNPTWFAFVAWCQSLTINVHPTNCTPFSGSNGVQVAIYSNCNYTPVVCNVQPSDCNTNDKLLSMTNLVIGQTYYFLIDGCSGAYCDVEIDVIGTCGAAFIATWSQPIDGPQQICAGSSPTFSVESLFGARDYHWYVDGLLVGEGNGMTSWSQLWQTTGTYEICVDVSNEPCIPEADNPAPTCILVQVVDSEAGDIMANPNPVCPTDTIDIVASGYTVSPSHTQFIVITDDSGIIVDVVNGDMTSWTYDACGIFFAYSYNVHNASPNDQPQIGADILTLSCPDGCCDQEMIPIEFIDNEDPVFDFLPPDLMLTCYDLLPPMDDLGWTDNCDGNGMVSGIESGSADLCNGGTITRQWEYVDQCGNMALHAQTITIDPLPLPVFSATPADVVVDCSNIPMSAPTIQAMNVGVGGCQILADVVPVQNGTADVCGGSFTFTWEFTDTCGRTISHVQNITVTPIPQAMFDAPPADTTVMCDAIPVNSPVLNYSNGGTGTCEISGSVAAQVNGTADLCGGEITYEWEFTDTCGRSRQVSQTITVEPVPEAQFVNPPSDTTMMCTDVPSSFPNLNFTNGLTGSCLIEGTVSPTVDGSADACGGSIVLQWEFTDACNRVIEWEQRITVLPAAAPMWLNPPADTTVDCGGIPVSVPSLSYSNGETGSCAISGSVPGTLTQPDLCQGFVEWTWEFTDNCNQSISHVQRYTINSPSPVAFTNPPTDITVSCDAVPAVVPSLNYTNGAQGPCLYAGSVPGVQTGNITACGGQLTRTWSVVDPCGMQFSHIQSITVDPAPPAVFGAAPPDVTLNCNQVPSVPPALSYTNGASGVCVIAGSVNASVSGSYNACGGAITYNWNFTDLCGRSITASQNVTVLAAPAPAFNNLPADMTIECSQVPASAPALNYTNGLTGACGTNGAVNGVVSGAYDQCGGSLAFQWSFTDACGNALSHIQQITVTPASDPVWLNTPDDISLGCDDVYEPPDVLAYTNSEDAPCEIGATVDPVVIFDGSVYTHSWSYTHPCTGVFVEHVQMVTVVPPTFIEIDPDEIVICEGQSFDLSTIFITELNNTPITTTFHTNSPADAGNMLPSSVVSPLVETEYVVLATNGFGCTHEVPFLIYVDPALYAGEDFDISVCESEFVNLDNFISSGADPTGYWIDADGSGADISNPSSVSFNFVDPGTYLFQYIVEGPTCPSDTADFEVTIAGEPEYTIDTVYCTGSNMTYTVVISGPSIQISGGPGDIVMISDEVFEVQNIPIDQIFVFDVWDPGPFCAYTVSVSPPNCDCPSVPPASGPGTLQVCVGEGIPQLVVNINADQIANWYDMPTGGTLLAADTTAFVPPVSNSGTYIYYVETESIEFPGCVSSTRIPVTLEILSLPVVNDVSQEFCDDGAGSMQIDLSLWQSAITSNGAAIITFHPTNADALGATNVMSMPVAISLGQTIVYARIEDANGCASIAELTIELHTLPSLEVAIVEETCVDAADGILQLGGFDPTLNYIVTLNGMDATNVWLYENLPAGAYPISIELLETGCTFDTIVTIPGGTDPLLSITQLICNDNGTSSDASDDFYSVTIEGSGTGIGAAFDLLVNGDPFGQYTYSDQHVIELPATGQPVLLTLIDTQSGCAFEVTTQSLVSCSSDCFLVANLITLECLDNGTPSDPADDLYNIIINITAFNGAASGQYHILEDGVITQTATYGENVSLIVPVASPPASIEVRDEEDLQCFEFLNLGPLTPCSDDCAIMLPQVDYMCSDSGTPDDPSDDQYFIAFIADVLNAGPSNTVQVLIDQINLSEYAVGSLVQITLPADGQMHSFEMRDKDLHLCETAWTTPPLIPCSSQCQISVENQMWICQDNGTPLDPADDYYDLSFLAQATFGAADGMFDVLLDGLAIVDGVYGSQYNTTVPADGQQHEIIIIDHDDPTCTSTWTLDEAAKCSNDCLLDLVLLDVLCDNNGTNQTDTDDVFFAMIVVNGINVSGQWVSSDGTESGLIGMMDTLGPFLISQGDKSFILEAMDASCSVDLNLLAPMACSSCDQTMSGGTDQFIDCGTPSVTLTITASDPGNVYWIDPVGNTSAGAVFEANLAGVYVAVADFGDGCILRDTVIVDSDSTLPTVSGGPDAQLDCGTDSVILTATIVTGVGPYDIYWTDTDDNPISSELQMTANAPGVYFVQVYDHGVDCWSAKDAVVVTDLSNSPSAVIYADPGNLLSCLVESVILTTGMEQHVAYSWMSQGALFVGDTLEVIKGGTITLIALDTLTQCSSRDSIVIDELVEYPVIIVQPLEALSCDVLNTVLDASQSIVLNTGVFIWTNEAGDTVSLDKVWNADSAGVYYLALTDPDLGCISFDTIEVMDISHDPEIIKGADQVMSCGQARDTVFVELLDDPAGLDVQWTAIDGEIIGASNGPSAVVSGEGLYVVIVTDLDSGCEISDTVNVSQIIGPYAIVAEGLETSCAAIADGVILIDGALGGTAPYYFEIDGTPVSNGFLDELEAGAYLVSLRDANNCVMDTVISIEVGDEVTVVLEAFVQIKKGDTHEMVVSLNIPADEVGTVQWTPTDYLTCDTCLVTETNPEEDITYEIEVTDINGCSATATVQIKVAEDILIYIPNAFSPGNGDGINDFFTAYTNQPHAQILSMEIFDRWGEVVFSKKAFAPNQPESGWDGTFASNPLNPAVFVYVIEIQLSPTLTTIEKGDVTIVR